MSEPVVFAAPADVELSADPIRPQWIIEGTPQARSKRLAPSADDTSMIMASSCTAGRFEWHYAVDETVHLGTMPGVASNKINELMAALKRTCRHVSGSSAISWIARISVYWRPGPARVIGLRLGRPPPAPPPPRSLLLRLLLRPLIREGDPFGLRLPSVALAAHVLEVRLELRQPLLGQRKLEF